MESVNRARLDVGVREGKIMQGDGGREGEREREEYGNEAKEEEERMNEK